MAKNNIMDIIIFHKINNIEIGPARCNERIRSLEFYNYLRKMLYKHIQMVYSYN